MSARRRAIAVAAAAALAAGAASAPLAGGDPERGRVKSAQCAGCHEIAGFRSVFPEVYPIPLIEGQNPLYIEHALRQYRSGARSHPSMESVAGVLSDEDIADLAAHYGRPDAE